MLHKQIQVFDSPEFGAIRTIQEESPLFCLVDVCKALDLNPSKVSQRLDKGVLSKYPLATEGGEQLMNFVNEEGLYDCIFDSRKPEAKMFRKWVTSEVLPSIRKTGGYIATKADDTPEEIMARALVVAQETIARKEERIKALQDKVEEDAPRVLYAQALETSKDSILIGELARILKQNGVEIGQNRLFEWLRDNGYLCKSGEQRNQPTQKSLEMGLFEIKKTVVMKPNGDSLVSTTTKTTQKGQSYFINKFVGGQIYE